MSNSCYLPQCYPVSLKDNDDYTKLFSEKNIENFENPASYYYSVSACGYNYDCSHSQDTRCDYIGKGLIKHSKKGDCVKCDTPPCEYLNDQNGVPIRDKSKHPTPSPAPTHSTTATTTPSTTATTTPSTTPSTTATTTPSTTATTTPSTTATTTPSTTATTTPTFTTRPLSEATTIPGTDLSADAGIGAGDVVEEPTEWIAGVPNNYVIAGGVVAILLVLFLLLK